MRRHRQPAGPSALRDPPGARQGPPARPTCTRAASGRGLGSPSQPRRCPGARGAGVPPALPEKPRPHPPQRGPAAGPRWPPLPPAGLPQDAKAGGILLPYLQKKGRVGNRGQSKMVPCRGACRSLFARSIRCCRPLLLHARLPPRQYLAAGGPAPPGQHSDPSPCAGCRWRAAGCRLGPAAPTRRAAWSVVQKQL